MLVIRYTGLIECHLWNGIPYNLNREIFQMEHDIFKIFSFSTFGESLKGCPKFKEMFPGKFILSNGKRFFLMNVRIDVWKEPKSV